jgi:hypothetical protein
MHSPPKHSNAARGVLLLIVAIAAQALSACTVLPQACAPPADSMVTAEMYFGRKVGDDERGALVREPSKLVLLIFRDELARRESLGLIAEAYKRQFRQQSVLISLRASCVSF